MPFSFFTRTTLQLTEKAVTATMARAFLAATPPTDRAVVMRISVTPTQTGRKRQDERRCHTEERRFGRMEGLQTRVARLKHFYKEDESKST